MKGFKYSTVEKTGSRMISSGIEGYAMVGHGAYISDCYLSG